MATSDAPSAPAQRMSLEVRLPLQSDGFKEALLEIAALPGSQTDEAPEIASRALALWRSF